MPFAPWSSPVALVPSSSQRCVHPRTNPLQRMPVRITFYNLVPTPFEIAERLPLEAIATAHEQLEEPSRRRRVVLIL